MLSKTKIKITFPTLLFFAILFFNFNLNYTIPFIAAFCHEMGHIIVMKKCGQKIKQMSEFSHIVIDKHAQMRYNKASERKWEALPCQATYPFPRKKNIPFSWKTSPFAC